MANIKIEEQLKGLIENEILEFIKNYNIQNENKDVKLVIGGGSAINYYFKTEDYSDIFSTHDFDIRCVYDNFIEPENDDEILRFLRYYQMDFIYKLCDYLNKIDRSILFEFGTKVIESHPSFKLNIDAMNNLFIISLPGDSPLQSINYSYSLDGNYYIGVIVDTMCFSRLLLPYYGKYYIKEDKSRYSDEELYELYNSELGAGFVKNYLTTKTRDPTIVENSEGEYYVSLGYILWDTVRMLRICHVTKNPKYIRYIKKYVKILSAFNNPIKYLKCDTAPIKDYCENCKDEIVDEMTDESKSPRERGVFRTPSPY
jgi:hypothetical protein